MKTNIVPNGCRHEHLFFFFSSVFPCSYATPSPFIVSAWICWGSWREEVEQVESSPLPADGECSVPTACHGGAVLSSLLPFSTFAGWLDSFSSCLHLLQAVWGRKHLSLCTAKRTNFCPLGSWLHCNKDYDTYNGSFVSYWQGSPGRRGPQGEQGEPGPKVSPDTQPCRRLCLLQAVSEIWCRSAASSVQLDVFIPGLSWTP